VPFYVRGKRQTLRYAHKAGTESLCTSPALGPGRFNQWQRAKPEMQTVHLLPRCVMQHCNYLRHSGVNGYVAGLQPLKGTRILGYVIATLLIVTTESGAAGTPGAGTQRGRPSKARSQHTHGLQHCQAAPERAERAPNRPTSLAAYIRRTASALTLKKT